MTFRNNAIFLPSFIIGLFFISWLSFANNADEYTKIFKEANWEMPKSFILKNNRFKIRVGKNGWVSGLGIGNVTQAFNEMAIYVNGVKNRPWCLSRQEGCIPSGCSYIQMDNIQLLLIKGKFILKEEKEISYSEIILLSDNSLNITFFLEAVQDKIDIDGQVSFILPYHKYDEGSWNNGVQSGEIKKISCLKDIPEHIELTQKEQDGWNIFIPPNDAFKQFSTGFDNKEIFLNYLYQFKSLSPGNKKRLDVKISLNPTEAPNDTDKLLNLIVKKIKSKPYSRNMIKGDNSFETGIGNWGLKGNAYKKYCIDSSTSVDGKNSLKLHASPEVNIRLSTNSRIPLKANTIYTLSAYLKSNAPNARLEMKLLGRNARHKRVLSISNLWQRYSLTFKTPPNKIAWCMPLFSFKGYTLWIDGVQLEEGNISKYESSEPISIGINGIDKPGNIYYQDSSANIPLDINIRNNTLEKKKFYFTYKIVNYAGESILTRANSIELDAGELIKEKLKFPLAMRGFFLVSCNVADCNAKVKTEASFCIVPHPLGASKENAFMGICFIQTKEPEMLKRIGVESILVHPTWSAIEPEKGKFSWNSFDEEMKAYKKNNFQIIGSFPPFPPKWAARALKEKKYDDYAAYIEEYMYQLVNRYKSTIKIWDFWSEADLSIQKNIYGNTEKEQIANYARFIKAGYSGAKRADPDCVFAACGTSGVDCRSLSFSSAVFEHASEYIDAFPVHPYSWPRELGPNGLDAVGPEASGLRKKMEDSKKFINSYGKKQLWIGELGWALDRRTPLDSSYAKEFSNYLVRAFIIARSVPGLTKCIWYTNEDWLANREGDYGLWRWNGNPTPAAAAYAMTSYFLNGVKEITNECKLNLGSNVEGYLFPKKMGFVAAFWSSTSQNIVIDIPLKADKISLFDIMGNPIEKSINKNNESILKLELSNSPVWVVSEKPLSFCSEVLPKISQENQCEVFAKNIRIQQDPLKLDFAFKNSTTLTVLIKNETPQELFGKVKIILPEGEYSNMVAYENLKPGEVRNLDFCITDLAFNKMNHSKMKIIGESNLGNVQTIITPEILSIPFNKSNINVDGDLGDWKNFTPVKLNKVAQLSPPDATAHNAWIGLDDLSANIYCAWDEKNFYFAAEVIDDAHENKYTGRNIYNGDAIQIAFDTGNDATSLNDPPQYDLNNDYEYTLALTSKGPEVFRHFAPVKKKEKFLDIPIAIKRKNKKTLYEVAIPRADLEPFNIQQGTVFGFNFVIFDKDGDGAMLYWLGLSPGIAGGKNPTLFKKFMLGK